MTKDVAIVALDINTLDPKFINYNALTAVEKIDLITKKIETACQELKTHEPDAHWIISWREYGITATDQRFITNEEKKYFKSMMKSITKRYANLTIISGTVAFEKAVYKNITKHIKKVKAHYSEAINESQESKRHYEQVVAMEKDCKNLKKFYVVRNPSYVFENGECNIRHDKTMPFVELTKDKNWWQSSYVDKKKSENKDYIYQPNNKKTNQHIFKVARKQGCFYVGEEICREHFFHLLQKEADKKKVNPYIQFIIAQGMTPLLGGIVADYAVLLDAKVKPQLLVKKPMTAAEIENQPVRLYQLNVLENEPMYGPLKPVSIHEGKQILNELNELIPIITQSKHILTKELKIKAINRIYTAYEDDVSLGKPLDDFKYKVIKDFDILIEHPNKKPNQDLLTLRNKVTDIFAKIRKAKFPDYSSLNNASSYQSTKTNSRNSNCFFSKTPYGNYPLFVVSEFYAKQKLSVESEFGEFIQDLVQKVKSHLNRNIDSYEFNEIDLDMSQILREIADEFSILYTRTNSEFSKQQEADIESLCINRILKTLTLYLNHQG